MPTSIHRLRRQLWLRLNGRASLPAGGWAMLFGLGFVLTAITGTFVGRYPTGEPVDWLASSFLIAILVYLQGRTRWTAAALCVLADMALQALAGRAWPEVLALPGLMMIEAGLGAAILLRLWRTPRLLGLPRMLKLVALVIVPTTAVTTLLYGGFAHLARGEDIAVASGRWLVGHGGGMLIALPLLILLKTPFKARFAPLSPVETVAYSALYLLLASSSFNGLGLYLFFIIPPSVALMAFRMGPRITAMWVAGLTFIGEQAYYLTPALQVPPPGFSKDQTALFAMGFSLAMYLGGLLMALAVYYHVRLKRQLEIRAEAARRARARAILADRAKSEFLATMSHEIRTPLNGVIGVADALGQTRLTRRQREMVSLIESSGVTLARLVSGILDVSKIEAGRLELELGVFDLRAELEPVVELFRMQAQEKGLSLTADYGLLARGRFVGDAVRVKQVLGNLMSNAVKFTGAGEVRARIELTEPKDGEGPSLLAMEVQDTGVGFEPGYARQLFQRFSQADATISRRFGGTGLGLSITRGLVELMGGQITAEAEPGQGARFTVTLPVRREGTLAAYDERRRAVQPAGPADPAEPAMRGLRVLLAEDHPTNQRVVQLMLAPLGVDLTIVDNGLEAVKAFGAAGWDLVLMDMQMPVMDGLEATRRIRRLEGGAMRTPVIAMTANAMTQDRALCLEAGMDDFVSKPVDARQFLGVMDRWLGAGAEKPKPKPKAEAAA